MIIFPTTILLATDGSKEAELAARTAVDIAATTNSELHMAPSLATSMHMFTTSQKSQAMFKRACMRLSSERPESCSTSK